VRLLIDKGAACDINTPLTWAITALGEKDKELVELLISGGADINLADEEGRTPMYWAAFHGSQRVFGVVLAKVTDRSTLPLAAFKGDLNAVRAFVQSGADVNAADEFGCTPLHWAAAANVNDVADFLVANGADVNAEDNDGLTPLLAARRLDMIRFLVSKGADVNVKGDTLGYTRLHKACQFENDLDVATFLISKGADVNTRNNWGITPLIGTSTNGNREMVQLLIDNGADVNMGYWNGTPLLVAAAAGHTDVVKLLIDKGANINASDDRGRTPLSRAQQQGHSKIVELLRQHGAQE
jgi:ankyrin repeat protein